MLQNFSVFWQYHLYCIICNLSGFRNCVEEYTVLSLLPCYGLLTA